MKNYLSRYSRVVAVVVIFVAAALTHANIQAQNAGPSREPILRIETGMHTAAIKSIGVDRAGRFLVTASDDKTARVWDVRTGRLLGVLRVPIGDGAEGKLYSAAISPDGDTIAVGGFTGFGWDKKAWVYLLDRESGRLVRRLIDLPEVVFHLAFSPDGALLAATLGANGVRVWRTSDWAEVGRDTAYGNSIYGADFDRAGRLVTSCYDGNVRLYDPAMRQSAKRAAPGGKRPSTVRFSPDGRKVAVGYVDSTRVDVLNGETLDLLYSADTSDINNGSFAKVAWSADGTMLYAGGTAHSSVTGTIRRWSDAGRGRYVDTPAASGTILDIAALPTGGIVYGTSDPSWGILDSQHRRTQTFQAGQIADYRNSLSDQFLTDARASAIRFGYEQFGKSPTTFQLTDRTLDAAPTDGPNWRSAETDVSQFRVTEWRGSYTPKFNGTPLNLETYERSHSLAIAPGNQSFLLGTTFRIRLFNSNGQELWNVSAPEVAWAVNISGDGKLALAAYGDGTIRWYRMTDGKELLAFFPHRDRKRWILWTPSGYYDASPGAEELIGWHVNNGADKAADFFPVNQFRDTYYRPDVIDRVLTTLDEQTALKQANEARGVKQQQASVAQQLPPVVEIISPTDGSTVNGKEVTIRYRLRSPSGQAVTGLKGLVNGRPAVTERGLNIGISRDGSDVREMKVNLVEADSAVSIIAENQYTSSVPATVRVRAQIVGTGGASLPMLTLKPTLYVLAVGVSHYSDTSLTLGYPAKDARDFTAAMVRQKGGLYADVVTKILTDEDATRDNIADGLDWITKQTTARDVAMVFIAGHGVMDQGDYFYLPYNADLNKLIRTSVAYSDIKRTVERLAGKTLFFVDTCHSGRAAGGPVARDAGDMNGLVNDLIRAENGAVVFAASTGRQSSLEDVSWGNGAFTKALVEGLNGGGALFGDAAITINTLDAYIARRVKELTGGRQTPTTQKPNTIQDFPIAVKK